MQHRGVIDGARKQQRRIENESKFRP